MKSILLYSLLAITIVLSGSGFACNAVNDLAENNSAENGYIIFPRIRGLVDTDHEIVIECEIPAVDSLMVYKVTTPDVTEAYVNQLGTQMGLQGNIYPVDDNKLTMVDQTAEYERYLKVYTASGCINYSIPEIWFPVVESQPALPSIEEAKAMADQFLEDSGLPLIGATFREVRDGDVQTIYDEETGQTRYIVQRQVVYDRLLDGNPVIGAGQKVRVDIGELGITKCLIYWRALKSDKKMPAISFNEALANLQNGNCSTHDAAVGTEKVVIDEINIAYWSEGITADQDYVYPLYQLTGRCLNSNGEEIRSYTAWINALEI